MIKIAITLAMLLCATATHAQTVIEKLCIVTAAQDLPRVPGLEIKASRITVAPAESRQSGHEIFWRRDRCCGRRPKHDLRLPAGPRRGGSYLRDRSGSCARLARLQKAGSANSLCPLQPTPVFRTSAEPRYASYG